MSRVKVAVRTLGCFVVLSSCFACSDDARRDSLGEQCATRASRWDQWPAHAPEPSWGLLATQAQAEYGQVGYDWRRYFAASYAANGDYLNFASTGSFEIPGPTIQFDSEGVPMFKPEGAVEFFYSSLKISQFALWLHSLHTQGYPLRKEFWSALRKLQAIQSPDGAFRVPFPAGIYQAGWISGMNQAVALSALARAYTLDHDDSWLASGTAAFEFLRKPVSEGGPRDDLSTLDSSLSRYVMLEEYPEEVPNFTLNGFGFIILGLYDWCRLESASDLPSRRSACELFECSAYTFEKILPYYDIGGFSSYDMTHVTKRLEPRVWPHYHEIHLGLLQALASLVPSHAGLRSTLEQWASDVGQPIPTTPPTQALAAPSHSSGCAPRPAQSPTSKVATLAGTCPQVPTRMLTPGSDSTCVHWTKPSEDGCTDSFAMTCPLPELGNGWSGVLDGDVHWDTAGSAGVGSYQVVVRDGTGAFMCEDAYTSHVAL